MDHKAHQEYREFTVVLAILIVTAATFLLFNPVPDPTGFTVIDDNVTITENVEDADFQALNTTLELVKDNETVYNSTDEEHSVRASKGRYNITIMPKDDLPVKKIELEKDIDADIDQIVDIDEIPESGTDYSQTYAIDPKIDEAVNASITVTATGKELFKCADWDFEARECQGEWVKLLDTVPGQNYTIKVDCGFKEKGGCKCKGIRYAALESGFSFDDGTGYEVTAEVFKGSGTNPSQLIDEESIEFDSLPQSSIDDNPGTDRGNLIIQEIDDDGIRINFHNTTKKKLLGDNTFKITIRECEEEDDDECEEYDTTIMGPDTIHLSCSQPIDIGDTFGDFEVIDIDKIMSGSDCEPGDIDLIRPPDGSTDSDGEIDFEYSVYAADQSISFCELIIDDAVYQTDYSIHEGVSQFFSESLPNGTYAWSVNCTTSNGYGIESDEWTFEVSETSQGCDEAYFTGSPTSAYLHYGSDVTDEVSESDNDHAYQYVCCSPRYIYLDWESNISDISSILDVNLTLEHRENNIDMTVQWWDGSSWIEVCDPPNRGYDTKDYCDLTSYIDTAGEANDISLRLKLSKIYSPGYEKLDWAFMNITYCQAGANNIRGVITDSKHNPVASDINVFDQEGQLVLKDDELYDFNLADGLYDVQVRPESGSLKELYIYNLSVTGDIVNFTKLEDSSENATVPSFLSGWTELVSWKVNPLASYDLVRINFSYGPGTGLALWKCTDFDFDSQVCLDDANWTSPMTLPDGPGTAVAYFDENDPIMGAGPWWDFPPRTFLTSPSDGFTANTSGSYNITLSCWARDLWGFNRGIKNISLYLTDSQDSSFSLNETITFTGSNIIESASFNKTLEIGNYTWNCIAYDNGGNYDWADSNRSILILSNDTSPPVVTLVGPPDSSIDTDGFVTFEYNVTDENPIDYCGLVVNDTVVLTDYSVTRNITQQFNYTLTEGSYDWYVNCTDIYDNQGQSAIWTINVDIPSGTPNVSLISPPDNFSTFETNLSFRFNVVDDDLFVNCSIYLDNALNQTLYNVQNNTNNTFNITGINPGYHDWKVSCTDADSNIGWSETWTFLVRANHTGCCCGLSVSTTPEVANQGEIVLVSTDVANLLTGEVAFPEDIKDLNITIYRVENSSEVVVVDKVPMTYLVDGLWYYEFNVGDNASGAYIASVTMVTNQTIPFVKRASDAFTVGDRRSGLSITGVSPDLVNTNETVRLAAEIKFDGIAVDAGLITSATLVVTQINGSVQNYTSNSSVQIIDGMIYVDGAFNETGVYYLDWTANYLGTSRTAREIVVVVGWEELLQDINYTVNTELLGLIKETRQYLLELLTDMEYMQQFTEEEIFLITDSVNSMTRVVNFLETGQISNDDAERRFNEIRSELEAKLGGKITGMPVAEADKKKAGTLIEKVKEQTDDWRFVMFIILLLIFGVLIVVVLLLIRIMQTGGMLRQPQNSLTPKQGTAAGETQQTSQSCTQEGIASEKRRYAILIDRIRQRLQKKKEIKGEKSEETPEKTGEPEQNKEKKKD